MHDYLLERRALQGLVAACTPRPKRPPPPRPEQELVRLRRELDRSRRECQRQAALVRATLETLRGELAVPEACRRLGIGESRFHDLRGAWLQEALELLEPRPLGRPPRAADPAPRQARIRALESENRTLRQQLTAAEVRRELAEVLPHVVHAPEEAVKQGASAPPPARRPR